MANAIVSSFISWFCTLMILIISFVSSSASALIPLKGVDLIGGKPLEVAAGKKGTVVVFLSAVCPCSNSHVPVLKKLAVEFRDFSFVAVHSNVDEEKADAVKYFRAAELPFPVLQDERGLLAEEFKALKTPHAFLLDPEGKVLFKGGVTNSHEASTAGKHYLRDALGDVSSGRPVAITESRPLGCGISRAR